MPPKTGGTKRKAREATSPPVPKRVRTARAIATKEPRRIPAANTTQAPESAYSTLDLHPAQPPQQISERDLFILHCRDNLVPGATGPKEWESVAAVFNTNFHNVLKKHLSYKTLQKRCGVARKVLVGVDPRYAGRVAYPVSVVKEEGGEQEEGDEEVEDERGSDGLAMVNSAIPYHLLDPGLTSGLATTLFTPHPSSPSRDDNGKDEFAPQVPQQNALLKQQNFANTPVRGSFNLSSVSKHHISVPDRTKFHLRHRTSEPVTFLFPEVHEASLISDKPQSIDASLLLAVSPLYPRIAVTYPPSSIIDVPPHISIRTVNIFTQLIAPVLASSLPTHYLWKSSAPVPGIYDRFGAIEAEKIVWTLDNLLDLLLFAREQKRVKDVFRGVKNGYLILGGGERKVYVGNQMPAVENGMPSLAAEDFGEEVLGQLVQGRVDGPTLRFVADILRALGGEPDLTTAPEEVRDIFTRAGAAHLAVTSRQAFCERYHHHGSSGCYTAHNAHPPSYFIVALYATSTQQELITLSDGLLSATSLASILYSSAGDASKMKKDDSSAEMVRAEMTVLDIESRLEGAKEALGKAREAGEEEKGAAVAEAMEVVEGLYGGSD